MRLRPHLTASHTMHVGEIRYPLAAHHRRRPRVLAATSRTCQICGISTRKAATLRYSSLYYFTHTLFILPRGSAAADPQLLYRRTTDLSLRLICRLSDSWSLVGSNEPPGERALHAAGVIAGITSATPTQFTHSGRYSVLPTTWCHADTTCHVNPLAPTNPPFSS